MHKLIIRAHPKADSGYNHALLQAILDENIRNGNTCEVLDLYKDMPQGFLHFDRQEIPHQKEIQSLITKVDELIFLFPIRWLDGPAILKNFLDCNLSVGFAYEQKEGKTIGLLKGKTARIVATAGGPAFFYPFIWFVVWNKGRIGFSGMKLKSMQVLAHTMKTSDTKRKKFLDNVAKRCSR